jgi:hypothetical protein
LRNYDAVKGRFDRPDPLGLGAVKMGDPGSWNRFAYVQGDPVNYKDPKGLIRSEADEDNEEGFQAGWVYAGMLQNAAAERGSKYGPVTGNVQELTQFSIDFRNIAHESIRNMSQQCKEALGQHWNLFNGLDSLMGKADPANSNAVKFYDGRTAEVKNMTMSQWGWSDNGDWTVSKVFATPGVYGFTSEFGGKASNDIVLGQYFFDHPEIQIAGMLHEMLHAYTGMKDQDLARTLGLGALDTAKEASGAITKYLQNDCSRGVM